MTPFRIHEWNIFQSWPHSNFWEKILKRPAINCKRLFLLLLIYNFSVRSDWLGFCAKNRFRWGLGYCWLKASFKCNSIRWQCWWSESLCTQRNGWSSLWRIWKLSCLKILVNVFCFTYYQSIWPIAYMHAIAWIYQRCIFNKMLIEKP